MSVARLPEEVASPTRVPRPVVVVSQCLGFEAVRFNGQVLHDRFVSALEDHVRFVQVCPEVAIGLGVPRDPIRLVSLNGDRRLVQPSTGADLTERMRGFAERFVEELRGVDGLILKSRSPSCGIKDVRVYSGEAGMPSAGKAPGMFAEVVQARLPGVAVEDEGRLTNARIRHHFLTRVFAAARLRRVRASGEPRELVRFHTEYKLQWMAYGQAGLRELGRLVAIPDQLPWDGLLDRYTESLGRLLARPPRTGATINALMHAFGYLSERLSARERAFFLDVLEDYRADRVPLGTVLTLLWSWVLRLADPYLAGQRIFEPYPRALLELTDSGHGHA